MTRLPAGASYRTRNSGYDDDGDSCTVFDIFLTNPSIAGTRTDSTRRKHKTCEEDKQLASLIAAGTNCVTIVAKAWDLHVDDILEVSC